MNKIWAFNRAIGAALTIIVTGYFILANGLWEDFGLPAKAGYLIAVLLVLDLVYNYIKQYGTSVPNQF